MEDNEFEITIDFKPGEGDPARVFKAMSGLIDSLQAMDSHLLEASFDVSLRCTLVLDEIESGSIKARFRDLIEGLPDEALKDVEWNRILGYFLVRGKYLVLDWLKDKDEIVDINGVKLLEGKLLGLAEETDLKQLPAYSSPKAETLLSDIRSVQESLENLSDEDEAIYRYKDNEVIFNNELSISNEVVREVLTKEVIESSRKCIIKVKKPDYLGQSMWAFYYDGRGIEAKITDVEWLT